MCHTAQAGSTLLDGRHAFTLKGHQVACEVWRSHANMLRNAKKGCSAWHHHTRAHLFLKKVLVTQRLLQPTLLGHVPLVCGRCV